MIKNPSVYQSYLRLQIVNCNIHTRGEKHLAYMYFVPAETRGGDSHTATLLAFE